MPRKKNISFWPVCSSTFLSLNLLLWSLESMKPTQKQVMTLQQHNENTNKLSIALAAKLCVFLEKPRWNETLEWLRLPSEEKNHFLLICWTSQELKVLFLPVRKYKLEWNALSLIHTHIYLFIYFLFMKPSKFGMRYCPPGVPRFYKLNQLLANTRAFVVTCQVHRHRKLRTFSYEEMY